MSDEWRSLRVSDLYLKHAFDRNAPKVRLVTAHLLSLEGTKIPARRDLTHGDLLQGFSTQQQP